MPTWYKTGTVALTNGSTAVVGTGTDFLVNAAVGWGIQLPDGKLYEIAAIASASSLTLARVYGGSTASGQAFDIIPTRGTELDLITRLNALITSYQGVYDGAGQGLFGAGTLATPGVRATGDTDTGLAWLAANALALIAGGVERLRVNSTGAVVTGLLSGTAVAQSATDTTTGRLLNVGYMGLGGALPLVGDCGVTTGALTPGGYAYSTSGGSSGGPTGVTIGTLFHQRRGSVNGETQIMVVEASTLHATGTVLSRARTAGAWSSWKPAGVDSSGSNANGRYIRFDDGTQLAWLAPLVTSASADVTWTFPVAFNGSPTVQGTVNSASASNAYGVNFSNRSNTAIDFRAVLSGARAAVNLDVSAFGTFR